MKKEKKENIFWQKKGSKLHKIFIYTQKHGNGIQKQDRKTINKKNKFEKKKYLPQFIEYSKQHITYHIDFIILCVFSFILRKRTKRPKKDEKEMSLKFPVDK